MSILIACVAAYFLIIVAAAWRWWSPNSRARSNKASAAALTRRDATSASSNNPTVAAWLFPATVILVGLPVMAVTLRWWQPFDGYDHTVSRDVNARVAALLAGEQLVAPRPLPPAMFATPEVERTLPLPTFANREWALLDPEFRQRLLLTMRVMRERHHIDMVLLEGFRSAQRQASLAALGPHVTLAAAGASHHQAGLAADCAFVFDGRIVIDEKDPRAARAYALYGEIAQSMGLEWGGAWRNLKDFGHVELRRNSARVPPPRA